MGGAGDEMIRFALIVLGGPILLALVVAGYLYYESKNEDIYR